MVVEKSTSHRANGTDGLWKDIYDASTDTILARQRESLIGSTKLNRCTGDGGGPENKLTVSIILLNRLYSANLILKVT
jgi:hypothetical protein